MPPRDEVQVHGRRSVGAAVGAGMTGRAHIAGNRSATTAPDLPEMRPAAVEALGDLVHDAAAEATRIEPAAQVDGVARRPALMFHRPPPTSAEHT